MQPYQKAADSQIQQTAKPISYLSKAASMLSYYIPANIAVKGINKLSPKLGEFVNFAKKKGIGDEDIVSFLREKHEKIQESQKKSEKKTIFDELIGDIDILSLDEQKQNQLNFLKTASNQLEQKGKSKGDSAFKNIAKKIKEVLSGNIGMVQGEAMGMQNNPQMQQSQQNQSNADQQLMAMMEKFSQSLR